MRMAEAVAFTLCLTCSAATADEAIDKSCASMASSRLPATPGTTVQALRISDPPRLFRVPGDETSRLLEIDVHTESRDATYIFICKTEPSQKSVLEMVGIR
jgi:hypothetical protein